MTIHKIFWTILSATTALSGAAWAAPEAGDAEGPSASVEEVVVVARRREERLQDVPLAVTAISGATLAQQNITSVSDLTTQSPSLQITPGLGSNKSMPTVAIRGLSQQENTILSDPSVNIYFGDVLLARPEGLNQSFIDIRSVEVLKGPQGTLFGRNTTGGAVLVRPNAPTDRFEGSLAVTIGNYNARNTEAMVNIPLSDKAQLRLAGGTNQRDGYIRDVLLNRDNADENTWTFRASVLFKPTGTLESLFVYNRFEEDDHGLGPAIYGVNPAGTFNSLVARTARNYPTLESMLADQQARGFYETASGSPTFNKVKTWDLANTTTWQASDRVTVKNILAYRQVDFHMLEDSDGLPIPLLEIERIDDFQQISEELQVFGQAGKLNWIAGLYYFREKGQNTGLSVTGGVDSGVLQPSSILLYPSYSNTWPSGVNTSYAVFAQGTYSLESLVRGLSLTVGARMNWDKRDATIRNRTEAACRFTVDADNNPATPEVNPGLAGCALPLSADFSEPTYNLSLDWKPDADTLIYLAHRHGYRTGGFAARAASEVGLARTFDPETVDDVELGLKRDWRIGDAFLRTNVAVYRAAYKHIQRLLTDPLTIPPTTVTVNAAEATIQGAEFEFLFKPTPWLSLSGFYAYTDAKFDQFVTPTGQDLSANPFSRTPKVTWSLSSRVILPIDGAMGDLSAGGTYYHSDGYSTNDDAQTGAFKAGTTAAGYELLNLDAQWENAMGSPLTLSVFVTNALEEKYRFQVLQILPSLGFDSRYAAPPRMFGVKLSYRFGG